MIPTFSVKKPMTVLVAVILVVLLGVVSFTRMTPDLMPEISVPYVIVFTSYAGASPEQVESTVTKPLEQSIATLDHIKTISSTSSENYSVIMLEFSADADMDAATMNIREQIGVLESSWNDYVGTPSILKISMDMLPISVVAVSRTGLDAIGVSNFYEDTLSAAMEGIEGVASVSATGLIDEKVVISLHQDKMDAVNEKVAAAVENEFTDGEKKIADGKDDLADAWDQLIEGQEGIDEARDTLKTSKKNIENKFDDLEKSLTKKLKQLQASRKMLAAMIAGIEKLQRDGLTDDASIEKLPDLYSDLAALDSGIVQLETAIEDLPDQKQAAIRSLYGAKEKLTDGEEQLEKTRDTLSDTEEQLKDSAEQLADSKLAALESTKMDSLLSEATVTGILSAENFSMPAGYADSDGTDWLVYVGDKLESAEELSNLILFDLGFNDLDPIRLSDVADVTVRDNADETYASIDGAPGLVLSFYKQSDYATATVSENIQKKFDSLSGRYEGLQFVSLMDQGDYIRLVIDSVLENIAVGAALAILILFLFLRDIRPTSVVACSIPISATFAIVLMYISGVTLNVISMAGLAVGVGMFVDNSIVVIENIYRLRKLGFSVVKACISGTVQVAAAITSSTLTTVCVFVPIVFVTGITRELFTDMALTITYSLLASLVIALTLVPAMSSGVLQKTRDKRDRPLEILQGAYQKSLLFVLRFRVPALLLCVVLLIASAVLAVSKGFSFMPDMESQEISVSIEMNDEDATLKDTRAVTDRIAARIKLLPEIKTVGAMSASSMAGMFGMSDAGGTENASIIYIVTNPDYQGRSTAQLVDAIEALCADQPCKALVSGSESLSSYTSALGGAGVVVNIYGTSLDSLTEAATDVAGILSGMESVDEVSDGLGDTTPALRVTVDKEKAMKEGLTVAQVFQYVSGYLSTDATVTEFENANRDVVLEAANASPTVGDVRNKEFTFADSKGKYKTVKLADIATFSETETLSNINRDGQRRYVSVSATLKEGYNITLETAAVQAKLASYTPPAGCSIEYAGENETIMDAMKDLVLMMLLAIVIVYLIMVAQFQSLLSPLIVMATIPLAFTGGLIALILCGMEVSIVAMIGFVMLVGIIVNNGIVLIDAMNQLRAGGMGRREAVVTAAIMRIRPVLMTALTTILGLIPLALGTDMGASLVQPVAVVAIGGLVYATFMTLYIVPAIYDLVVKKPPRAIAAEDLEITEA